MWGKAKQIKRKRKRIKVSESIGPTRTSNGNKNVYLKDEKCGRQSFSLTHTSWLNELTVKLGKSLKYK